MKAFVVFAVCIAAVAAGTWTKEVEEKYKKCQAETGASDEFVKRIKIHDFDFKDAAAECFSRCICHAKGFCDDKDFLQAEVFETKPHLKELNIDKAKFTAAIEKCNKATGANDCETVFNRVACFFKEVPEIPPPKFD